MSCCPRSAPFGIGLLLSIGLLAGCVGPTDEARSTLPSIQGTSYVTVLPTPTTTTLAPGATTSSPSGGQTSDVEQVYTVVSGDSLTGIASKHDITLAELLEYNQIDIDYFLSPGETTIRIPPGAFVPGSGSGTPTDDSDDSAAGGAETEPEGGTDDEPSSTGVESCEHTVGLRDNPTVLADRYGVSLGELAAANANNPAYGHFQLGSTIIIPGVSDCS